MSLNTSLKGRLRNTNLPKSHALFPLFEAVVNSIHSIDERIKNDKQFVISDASIKVIIVRSAQMSLDDSNSDITGFEIIDNGIGFTNKNIKERKEQIKPRFKKYVVTNFNRLLEKNFNE